jgi:hypothetical protein
MDHNETYLVMVTGEVKNYKTYVLSHAQTFSDSHKEINYYVAAYFVVFYLIILIY